MLSIFLEWILIRRKFGRKVMRVSLFIPCYIDQFYPEVGKATLELLERLGVTVDYPLAQTCCGQPMANAGYENTAVGAAQNFLKNFRGAEYIVAPSGSCTLHLKEHMGHLVPGKESDELSTRMYELTEFLTDVLHVTSIGARFPHRVGLHASCHGLRGLRLARASELQIDAFNKPRQLLQLVEDLTLVELDRTDECCGFGGTFSVTEEALSVQMGKDRIDDHLKHQAEVITGTDVSCLMHLEGLARRNKTPLRFMHIAEILNSR